MSVTASFLGNVSLEQCPNNTCADINDYTCSSVGLVFPLVNEYTWALEVRIFIYFLGLLWCFLGVAIIADVFMCSIEKITSNVRKIRVANTDYESGFEEIEVKVWNDTVANLTLMALGSSAPEILLSIIEVVGRGFEAGDLGPSTIVGSAAFNLLVITAVCVMSIGSPDVRRIAAIKVFAVTSFFSIFAYVWLIVVLKGSSPDYISIWEAVVTFLFFPLLVLLAYMADKNFCIPEKVDDTEVELGFVRFFKGGDSHTHTQDQAEKMGLVKGGKEHQKKVKKIIKDLKKNHPGLTEEAIAKVVAAKLAEDQPRDRMWYRINATRGMTGGHKVLPVLTEKENHILRGIGKKEVPLEELQGGEGSPVMNGVIDSQTVVVEFHAPKSAVLEGAGKVKIGIQRRGRMDKVVQVKVDTIDGTADADEDYVPIKETLIFEAGETTKYIEIKIIDDNVWEPDEVFFVRLSLIGDHECTSYTQLGSHAIHEVTIINDDEPGTFQFSKPSFVFKESVGTAQIHVQRINGADDVVNVKWKTEDITAKRGKDYEGDEGTLTFQQGETEKYIELKIYDDQTAEKDESFKVELVSVDAGAKLGQTVKTIVTCVNDDDYEKMVNRLMNMTNENMDRLRVDTVTWRDQFRNAMNVNGGDVDNASDLDYLMHFLTFGWKIMFACCPPSYVAGGWLAFFVALAMIGLLTLVVGDLASIAGCLVGLEDSVTAITLVALGTSLPDLFASKQAATMEKTADNSIGNVTGSNSVNVFLGLGIPWIMASVYHKVVNDSLFYYPAGSLVFSVIIYTVCASICIATLLVRRYSSFFGSGELGGTYKPKIATGVFFIFLWVMYILLSTLEAYKIIKVDL